MRNSRVSVHFGQSLELKGETDEAPPEHSTEQMTSTRVCSFTFHTSRSRAHAYIDNSQVCPLILVLVALHMLFTSPFLVNYVNVPLNWENKNSLLCKLSRHGNSSCYCVFHQQTKGEFYFFLFN